MTLDTVAVAGTTPELTQPWRELGLKEDEYARIREILGRRPTSSELATLILDEVEVAMKKLMVR